MWLLNVPLILSHSVQNQPRQNGKNCTISRKEEKKEKREAKENLAEQNGGNGSIQKKTANEIKELARDRKECKRWTESASRNNVQKKP